MTGLVADGRVEAEADVLAVDVIDGRLHAVREKALKGDECAVRISTRVPAVIQHYPVISQIAHPARDQRIRHLADLRVRAVVLAARAAQTHVGNE